MFTSVSVGIALSSAGYERPEDMLRDADTAMYRAKAGGRAGHQVFDGDMHQRAVSSLRLETDLRRALERGEIVPYYQPIVDLDDRRGGRVRGAGALAASHQRACCCPISSSRSPRRPGWWWTIGDWMLAEACRQMRDWQRKYPRWSTLGISVNVSGRQLAHGGVAADVERVLGATGLDPACLTLEITESALMHNLNAGAGVIQRLHAMSVGLHLDDFGTGYSSLAYLHSFPVHALKVDRSFVNRMDRASQQSAIVKAIVSLAHNLGMEVVAEGVETRGPGRSPPRAPLPARARVPVLEAASRGPGGTAPRPESPRRFQTTLGRDSTGTRDPRPPVKSTAFPDSRDKTAAYGTTSI